MFSNAPILFSTPSAMLRKQAFFNIYVKSNTKISIGVTRAMFGRHVRIAYISSYVHNNIKSAFRRWLKNARYYFENRSF